MRELFINRAAVLVLVVLGFGAALAAPGASAGGGKGCPDGAYCLWKKPNYRGDKLVVTTNKLFNFPRFMNNKASSFKNRVGVGRCVRLYPGKNGGGGGSLLSDNGASVPNLGPGYSSSDEFGGMTCI